MATQQSAQPTTRRISLLDDAATAELIERAKNRGYLSLKGSRVTYHGRRDYEDDYSDPEEEVRAIVFAWLILEKGYPASQIDLEVTVPRRTPSDQADIVVYSDRECRTPYLVVENKARGASRKVVSQAIEQAYGNANSLRVTEFVLFDNLDQSSLFRVQGFPPGERQKNLLGTRDSLPDNFGLAPTFRLVAGSSNDIAPCSARDLENAVRRAHGLIWAGGKRDPLKAFDEWCKLLFAKVYDERDTANGRPREFQVGSTESPARVAERVRVLYQAAIKHDPSIFKRPIDLPDDKIEAVVRTVQDCGFTLCDLDVLGAAFEAFFGPVFRGELGQYFTRRELARFTCAMLSPNKDDIGMDPTAGTGGFLLELLIQVWASIDREHKGRPDLERIKSDFALKHVFGIEIHETLARVCQTNLLLHKDGHTNVEGDRSCLDSSFTNPLIKLGKFTVVVGNPPFGDEIKQGDTDKLGGNRLFELGFGDAAQVDSEIVILARAIEFLAPGGRLGMVVPDGVLNNSGEQTRCPWLRRHLLTNGVVLAVVSLPDFAFRKAGAQNKTSLLFWRKFTVDERTSFESTLDAEKARAEAGGESEGTDLLEGALGVALRAHDYHVFLAEADRVGYTPSGAVDTVNELYSASNRVPELSDEKTILGQFSKFTRSPASYKGSSTPRCMGIPASVMFEAHASRRMDPKFHIFRAETKKTPGGMKRYRLGDLLERRSEVVIPNNFPNEEFKAITLTQEGQLEPREAGLGINPPAWFGTYFREDTRWFRVRSGDLLFSRIDIWKGSVTLVTDDFDGAIVTQEFPVYKVRSKLIDPRYLKLLLRTPYFSRAIRSITTGHSNRRRTQDEDFEALEVFLPSIGRQRSVANTVAKKQSKMMVAATSLSKAVEVAQHAIMGVSAS